MVGHMAISISRRSDLQPSGPRAQAGHRLAQQAASAGRLGRRGPAAGRLPCGTLDALDGLEQGFGFEKPWLLRF